MVGQGFFIHEVGRGRIAGYFTPEGPHCHRSRSDSLPIITKMEKPMIKMKVDMVPVERESKSVCHC